MRVIATAGHVDHGKSSLVQALSGINPDRLAEEKARGMTIDLGFAWIELSLPGQETPETIGIVDVPGHIDFIKNMLAGVGSVDAAVLVIAADEGVMPQTREHLAILDLLAVPTGLVALTKADLIDDPEWLELVELEVHELLEKTCLANAPIVPVSAHTGKGLDNLRAALSGLLGELPPRRDRARPRVPIDRIFSISGFGTIVTGTLSDGHFAVGDPVEILPDGPSGRIRGIQSHNTAIQRAAPGSRAAINLSGVAVDEIQRGQVVVKPGTLLATKLLDVSFRLLPDASKPLTHNLQVDFFSGASETPAHVRLLGVDELLPGKAGWLQLRLDRPVLVAAGDRYILRQPSPSVTLGGGEVLDPHPRRRYRRMDPAALDRLATLAAGAPDEILLQTLERAPLLTLSDLIGQSGLGTEPGKEALAALEAAGLITRVDNGRLLLARSTHASLLDNLADLLAAYHAGHPLRQGMARGEARSRLRVKGGGRPLGGTGAGELPLRAFNDWVEQAVAAGLIQANDAVLWLADHQIRHSPQQSQAMRRTLDAYVAAPFSPPNAGDTLALLGNDEELLESLVEQNLLLRISGGVFFRPGDFDTAIERIAAFARENGSVTLAQTRDLFDTSRKYAQALLEEMDARRMTRRVGDERVLR
ncbi:MAG: selenocysteine-specific translation elongation factor [Chloroflexi bacterium]|nr:MAG: selenocysteine-specific translation elongation factor [Chloroflexota bacterium]